MEQNTQAPPKEDQVTFGDKRVETSQLDRYKGRKGVVDRISILSSTLIRGFRYYHKGSKTSFRAPTDPATLAAVKEAMGEPEQRFALVVFHYTTSDTGELLDEAKCSGKVKLWAISESRYEELSALHKQWPLIDAGFGAPQHDLIIKCTEEQYQRMQFTPTPKAHWKSKEDWYKILKAKEKAAESKVRQTIGRQLTDAEILDLIGASTPAQMGSTSRAGDVDLTDVLEG